MLNPGFFGLRRDFCKYRERVSECGGTARSFSESLMRPTLAVHAVLLALAATNFTAVTFFFGEGNWEFCYFQYAFRSGFGFQYVSDYSLAQVLTYLAAFGAGAVAFDLQRRDGRRVIGTVGLVLSLLGLMSFVIEGSHWLFNHHRSYIAFSPVVMFVLSALTCIPKKEALAINDRPNPS
ncbi:MAG: hypothetical protein ACI93T_002996, partial [Porticoccaceae bacterium]